MGDKIGFVFPGQGSQFVNMGRDLYDSTPAARDLMDSVNGILGYDLQSIIFGEDEELLKQTQHTQPALFTVSAMYYELAKAQDINFVATAGHSLGEYSALYAAGFFSFEEGLKLVQLRGTLMAEQSAEGLGMAAVIGMDIDAIETVLGNFENVYIANINAPGQVVIAGDTADYGDIESSMTEAGASRFIPLKVSSAFHTPYMQPVAEKMQPAVKNCPASTPTVPVLPNVTAEPTQDIDTIKRCLIEQITGRVRWVDTINAMHENLEISKFYEVGPGKVLQGLSKRINRAFECQAVPAI